MKNTAGILTLTSILSKIFGFGRYITLAGFYGASGISDDYLIALTIPMSIFQFIGQGISTTFIPVFSKILSDHSEEKAQRYINNLINILIIICTALISMAVILSPLLVRLFASGFTGDTFSLAVSLTRITLAGIYFSVLMRVLTGYLHVKKSYIIPGLTGIPFNIIVIISIIMSRDNVYILATGTLLAMFAEFIMIVYASYKAGYRYIPVFDLKDPDFNRTVRLALPTIISTSLKDINWLVDRTLASRIATGAVSALSYATRLTYFLQQTWVTALITVMYPAISKMSAEKDIKGIKNSLTDVLNAVHLILIPAALGSLVFAVPIVNLVFGYGAFDSQAVDMTSYALIFYSLGMISLGQADVLSRIFFSLQDTKTPMIYGALGMTANIILNLILVRFLGIGGLALASSISAVLTASLLFISLRRKIGRFDLKKLAISFIKMLFSAVLMAFFSDYLFSTLQNTLSPRLSLGISILSGACFYFCLVYLLKPWDKIPPR